MESVPGYKVTAPLIRQSHIEVTIPPGEIPLLAVNMPSDEEAEARVVIAVNFLRCGIPEVQLLLPYSERVSTSRFTKMMDVFKEIERPDEHFKFFRHKRRIFSVIREISFEMPPP